MASLPDLDTNNISFISYWNAIDSGGLADISPEEVLSDNNIQEYTLYDNGVEGTYRILTGRDVGFRVKNDGWFAVYIDRTERFKLNVGFSDTPAPNSELVDIRGPWDIANDWTITNDATTDVVQNALERAINSLQSQLSNSGSVNYDVPDVGLYNYEYPDATTLTNLTAAQRNIDLGFTYTSDTTRYWHIIAFTGSRYNNGDVTAPSGTVLANYTFDPSRVGASYDMLANNEAPQPETEYIISVGDVNIAHANMILWG